MAFPIPAKRPGFSWIWLLLLTGLSLLSWASTYTGIMELITASSGAVTLETQLAVGFAVAMLQLMIVYILDALFSEQLRWWLRPLYLAGYAMLFLIAVGFAFGFYWKYLEAGSVTTSAAEASLLRIQEAMQLGTSRMEQLQSTFATLETISAGKAEQERTAGGTCVGGAGGGGGGDGPRRRLRDGDAQRFRFANAFIAGRVAAVKTDMAAIGGELKKIADKDASTIGPGGSRAAFMGEMNRKLSLAATRFNALRSEPQLAQLADELKARGGQTAFPDDRGGTFLCPDPQLQTALAGVVRAIAELPALQPPQLRTFEGSEAVIEAFRRLTVSGVAGWHALTAGVRNLVALTGAVSEAPPAPASAALTAADGLTERDYIPLVIAVFVDLCILLVSINRPVSRVLRAMSSMETAQNSNLIAFLTPAYRVFSGEFDPNSPPPPRDIIAPLADVVFDHNGKYYAAAPLNARYISAAFDILQGHGFVKLLRNRGVLDDESVRGKLAIANGTYAEAGGFRVYEFAPNAWAEFLHAALGSGSDAEMRISDAKRAAAAALPEGASYSELPLSVEPARLCHATPAPVMLIACEEAKLPAQQPAPVALLPAPVSPPPTREPCVVLQLSSSAQPECRTVITDEYVDPDLSDDICGDVKFASNGHENPA